MAAKRKLWQLAAAHALLVSVPLYGSLPELTEIKRNSRRLVDESELSLARSAEHRAPLARAGAHSLELFVVCELAPARAVGAEKPLFRGRDLARGEQPPPILEVRCEIASGDCVWRNAFTYDPVGNRTRQDRVETTGTARTVSYGYDERDRLLSESSTGSTAYGWDENGNLVSKSGADGATYEWDFDNRLTKVTLANGTTVEHIYDVDGTRVRTTTTPAGGPAERVDYLVDVMGLSQVVAESNGAGAVTALHVRGDDLLATLRPSAAPPGPGDETWIARYFHADGLGSIRALANEDGVVSDRYDYSAFGELASHLGSDRNAYLFAGESLDPNVGWYYNRARWLDTESGRFGSVDPWPGDPQSPRSLHKYTYVGSRPANFTDPSGLSELLSLTIAKATAKIIIAFTIGVLIEDLIETGVKIGLASLGVAEASMLATFAVFLASVIIPDPEDAAKFLGFLRQVDADAILKAAERFRHSFPGRKFVHNLPGTSQHLILDSGSPRSGLRHILRRHTANYFESALEEQNTLFPLTADVEDIVKWVAEAGEKIGAKMVPGTNVTTLDNGIQVRLLVESAEGGFRVKNFIPVSGPGVVEARDIARIP